MELQLVKQYDARAWDGVVVPLGEGNLNGYQGPWEQELAAVRASGRFDGKTGEVYRFSVLSEGALTQIFLLGLGKDWSLEQVLESCAKVYRQCHEMDLRAVCTDLRGVCPQFTPVQFQKAASRGLNRRRSNSFLIPYMIRRSRRMTLMWKRSLQSRPWQRQEMYGCLESTVSSAVIPFCQKLTIS